MPDEPRLFFSTCSGGHNEIANLAGFGNFGAIELRLYARPAELLLVFAVDEWRRKRGYLRHRP